MRLLVLAGDGIGPEITAATLVVLNAAVRRFRLDLDIEKDVVGHQSLLSPSHRQRKASKSRPCCRRQKARPARQHPHRSEPPMATDSSSTRLTSNTDAPPTRGKKGQGCIYVCA